MNHTTTLSTLRARALITAASLMVGVSAQANGLGENRSWQFSTPFDTSQKANVRALIEQRKANGFRTVYNSYSYATNNTFDVAGDYVECAVAATTTGNESAASQSATVGSPSIGVAPGFASEAQGNVSDAIAGGGQGASLNSSSAGVLSPSASVTQSNSAPQTANVDGNTVQTSVGQSSGSGSGGSSSLTSSQSADSAVLNSTITASSACTFSASGNNGTQ